MSPVSPVFKDEHQRLEYYQNMVNMHTKYHNLEQKLNGILENKWNTKKELARVGKKERSAQKIKINESKRTFHRHMANSSSI